MTKKQRALQVIERLKKEYPSAGCTLDYDQAWKLLVSVRLAAQCTDARVNVVVEGLYEKYPTVEALAEAEMCIRDSRKTSCGTLCRIVKKTCGASEYGRVRRYFHYDRRCSGADG